MTDPSPAAVPTWEYVECIYCGQCHEPPTPCPPLEFPGTEWDQ